jgi:two-component system, OmpR family, phosphate regulon sensor histidine kinase PhoR
MVARVTGSTRGHVDGVRRGPGPGEDRSDETTAEAGCEPPLDLQREYVAMVLHDLRGPATAVAGMVELLQERWHELDPERIDLLLRRTRAAADRITRLSEDVVAAAALDATSFTFRSEVFDLVVVVRDTVEQHALTSGREVVVEVDEDLPAVVADAERQRQILGNLLGNAVKFAPEGAGISVGLERHGDEVHVCVHDEGTALAEDDLTRLFEPFHRVDRTGAGTGVGLGLAIVRSLVEGQGGRIWVDSAEAEGDGTRFVYTVPVARGGSGGDGPDAERPGARG